eukprot:CAMPEP_0185694648 /NCGR_PEP_ID=MMETSP1164-20130828/4031_1 /TAXON_ID=1104430 /ORGANISM="Chrysoreinhardia sp, Strain CCMP2950" /LENGTH=83 /DNA_ID=CAMNT_0028361493 /DNA_START=27 /DNA_END=274 /DNA_ORIENTATION=+
MDRDQELPERVVADAADPAASGSGRPADGASPAGPMLRRRRSQSQRKRLPPRTCCLALVLLVLGVALLVGAFVALGTGHDGAV